MKHCGRSSSFNLLVFVGIAALLLSGCAASDVLRSRRENPQFAAIVLHSTLDRWEQWRSLSARVKLKIRTSDANVRAHGHIIYLSGERYEVGFIKPYDRFVGNFYVTPEQFIYWDLKISPDVYGRNDSLLLSRLIPADVPDWNPRDLLPFPISGRSDGFQPDSIWESENGLLVSGLCGGAKHTLRISANGEIIQEIVERANYDPVVKEYSRYAHIHDWPIARRVTCMDITGTSLFTWTLSGIALDAVMFQPDIFMADTSNSGITP